MIRDYSLILATLALSCLISSATYAGYPADLVNAKCEKAGLGKGVAFHNFDKLIIKYDYIPNERGNTPEVFKGSQVKNRVEKIIRENFAPCLKDSIGNEKQIVSTTKHIDEMFDQRNVVLSVDLKYIGKGKKLPKDRHTDGAIVNSDIALLRVSVFRFSSEPVQAYALASSSQAFTFYPSLEKESLESRFDSILRDSLTPAYWQQGLK